jgi:hypothetical protein
MKGKREHATVASALRVANGVTPEERDRLVATWGRLDSRLRSFPEGSVELQLTVKERGTPSQRTTLEARIARRPRLVATSSRAVLDDALAEVRDDLIRQLGDAKHQAEPRNNRSLRRTLRGAGG